MVGTTNLGSFYSSQTQVGANTVGPGTKRSHRHYAAFDLGGQVKDFSSGPQSPSVSWLNIKRSNRSLHARLDECLEWISDSAHPHEHSDELRKLKRFQQVCNSSGYRVWDECLLSYWTMKRLRSSLMDLKLWIESEGQLSALNVEGLYRIANVCYAPYLLFYDLTHLHRYAQGHAGEPDPEALQCILDKLYLKKVSGVVGWGLFAREDLAAGVCIGEYTGVVRIGEQGGVYCMEYDQLITGEHLVIDAQYFGNHTRFVNHSVEAPNLEAIGYGAAQDGPARVEFVTQYPIQRGQQLLINYGDRYWLYKRVQVLKS